MDEKKRKFTISFKNDTIRKNIIVDEDMDVKVYTTPIKERKMMWLKVGTRVIPKVSKFKDQIGRIVEIRDTNVLAYGVKFEGMDIPVDFNREELDGVEGK